MQEKAIANTLRHAQAKRLVIELEQAVDGSIRIAIRDDGRGGLASVEGNRSRRYAERFRSFQGGELSIASWATQGFNIRGAIPAAGR